MPMSNLQGFSITEGGLLMSMDTRLAELERRHGDLEKQIADAMAHPGVDTLELSELKRRKLQLKDEIARVKGDVVTH